MKCTACGRTLLGSAKFCTGCGTPVAPLVASAVPPLASEAASRKRASSVDTAAKAMETIVKSPLRIICAHCQQRTTRTDACEHCGQPPGEPAGPSPKHETLKVACTNCAQLVRPASMCARCGFYCSPAASAKASPPLRSRKSSAPAAPESSALGSSPGHASPAAATEKPRKHPSPPPSPRPTAGASPRTESPRMTRQRSLAAALNASGDVDPLAKSPGRAGLAPSMPVAPPAVPLVSLTIGQQHFVMAELDHVMSVVDLDDLLGAFASGDAAVREYFCQDAVLRRLVWYVLQPQPPLPVQPDVADDADGDAPPPPPQTEEQLAAERLTKAKVVSSELFTNTDSAAVHTALWTNFGALDALLSYWRTPAPDMAVFVPFVRLTDFLMHERFALFVDYVKKTRNYLVEALVAHVHVPDVRTLAHGMLIKEACQAPGRPALQWSRGLLIPLVVKRLHRALSANDVALVVILCEFVSQLLMFHAHRAPHVQEELMELFSVVAGRVLSPVQTEYADEFLEVFLQFFPPRFEEQVDEASVVAQPPVDEEDREAAQALDALGPRKCAEAVEVFLCSRPFQRTLRQTLTTGQADASRDSMTPGVGSRKSRLPALDRRVSSEPLGLRRWRALVIVSRLVKLCMVEVDEAIIISGALQRFLEIFFEWRHHSMVHCLVVDTLKYMLRHSAEATSCWTFLEFGFITRALRQLDSDASSASAAPGFLGHVVELFNELDLCLARNELLSEAVASSMEVNEEWHAFRTERLPVILASYRYTSVPEKVERPGSFLERLQQAEDEAPSTRLAVEEIAAGGSDDSDDGTEEVLEEVIEEVMEDD